MHAPTPHRLVTNELEPTDLKVGVDHLVLLASGTHLGNVTAGKAEKERALHLTLVRPHSDAAMNANVSRRIERKEEVRLTPRKVVLDGMSKVMHCVVENRHQTPCENTSATF